MRVEAEEKRFWIPTLMGIGTAILFLGVTLIWTLWAVDRLSWRVSIAPIIDFVFGITFLVWGVVWYGRARQMQEAKQETKPLKLGLTAVEYKDIRHEVLPDREGTYYMGERLGFSVRLTNLLAQSCTREFWYWIQCPDGMFIPRHIPATQFDPSESKILSLGSPIFLGFVGIVRVVVMTGETEKLLVEEGKLPQNQTFLTIFAGYSRDREGYQLQEKTVFLTSRIEKLTLALVLFTTLLVALTIALIVATV